MIEFICRPELLGSIPSPVPAGRAIPEWFRRLDRQLPEKDAFGLQGLTAKACLPFVDAMTVGYILPAAYDITVYSDSANNVVRFDWASSLPFEPIGTHTSDQLGAPNDPHSKSAPFKFINPWQLKVPEGYSVIFTQPYNHAELKHEAFSGLVDCDRFPTTVNIPFLWKGLNGKSMIKAGTPIAQIIPIKRKAALSHFTVRAANKDELELRAKTDAQKYGEISSYAREWRAKK